MVRLAALAAAGVAAGLCALAGSASPAATAPEVGIFYYPWWGTPAFDGSWLHWAQNGHQPPADIASDYYPSRGIYSSLDGRVVRSQMREIRSLGVTTVISSWWGPRSTEDLRLPTVDREARTAGLRVAIQLEPWGGRTPATAAEAIRDLHDRGYNDFYVYDSTREPDDAWAAVLAPLPAGVRVFANTPLVGKARSGGFDGIYTYDVYLWSGGSFTRVCSQARKAGLLCHPSVGPGYEASRAVGDGRVQPRQDGRRYDTMWRGAIRARPDAVTITSYNEWHEGTQIEPAFAIGAPYASYEGAYGKTGKAAERAYLVRTAFWVGRLRAGQ